MSKMLSVIDIIEENDKVSKENEILQQELVYLMKENAVLEIENEKLKRYKELYCQYVLWKEW
jgi:regulator of replication initiation timing